MLSPGCTYTSVSTRSRPARNEPPRNTPTTKSAGPQSTASPPAATSTRAAPTTPKTNSSTSATFACAGGRRTAATTSNPPTRPRAQRPAGSLPSTAAPGRSLRAGSPVGVPPSPTHHRRPGPRAPVHSAYRENRLLAAGLHDRSRCIPTVWSQTTTHTGACPSVQGRGVGGTTSLTIRTRQNPV